MDERLQLRDHLVHELRQGEAAQVQRHLARLDAGDVEDVVDDGQQVVRVAVHALEVAPLVRRELARHALEQHARVAEDRVERRAELVRHVRQELRLGRRRLLDLEV